MPAGKTTAEKKKRGSRGMPAAGVQKCACCYRLPARARRRACVSFLRFHARGCVVHIIETREGIIGSKVVHGVMLAIAL